MCCAELAQVARNKFLSDRINEKTQALEGSCAQDGFLPRFSKGYLHRPFSSINGHEYGCCVTFEPVAVCKRKRQPREGLHTEFFQSSPGNPRQSGSSIH